MTLTPAQLAESDGDGKRGREEIFGQAVPRHQFKINRDWIELFTDPA